MKQRVDLTSDEDLTDEDGDIRMGDSTCVSASLGGEIFSSRESNIGESDNTRDGGKTADSEDKRSLVKSSEKRCFLVKPENSLIKPGYSHENVDNYYGKQYGKQYYHGEQLNASLMVSGLHCYTPVIGNITVVILVKDRCPRGKVDLTGDEDLTDEDGDIRMGDSTGVSTSLGGEIFSGGKKSWESTSVEGPQRQLFYKAMINRKSRHEVFSTIRILSVVSVQDEKKSGYGYLEEIAVWRAD
ncbi:hypothetical protein Tco_0228632 [Tanacetum coccineum]